MKGFLEATLLVDPPLVRHSKRPLLVGSQLLALIGLLVGLLPLGQFFLLLILASILVELLLMELEAQNSLSVERGLLEHYPPPYFSTARWLDQRYLFAFLEMIHSPPILLLLYLPLQ